MLVTRENIQPVAWIVLLAAFVGFLLVVVGGPLALRGYLRGATSVHDAVVETKRGTLALQVGGEQGTLTNEDPTRRVSEGWSLRSGDDLATAFIGFFDAEASDDVPGSTLNLEPHTELELRRLRRPRFGSGLEPPTVELVARPTQRYAGGLTAGSTWGRRRFTIDLAALDGRGLGRVAFAPESKARIIFIDGERARVKALGGAITVTNSYGQVRLEPEQRSEIGPNQAPSAPIVGTVNIVRDADFDRMAAEGAWVFDRRGPDDPTSAPGEALGLVDPEGRRLQRFEREGSGGVPADLYFRQALGHEGADGGWVDYDLRRADYLGVQARLRVLGQSVPGGGIEGSEYPLILRIRSIDQTAASPDGCEWTVGFYSLPPEEGRPAPVNGELVPEGAWIDFDSGNLLDVGNRFAFQQRQPPCAVPTHLIRAEVGVSGHDFASEIDRLEIHVE